MKTIRSILIRSVICFGLFFQLTIIKDIDKILQQFFPEKYTDYQKINEGSEARISKQIFMADFEFENEKSYAHKKSAKPE